MSEEKRIVIACSCEGSMSLDAATISGALAKTCPGATLRTAENLCRRELDFFRALLPQAGHVVVGCTQEAPVFEQAAEEENYSGALAFANIREMAGWSDQQQDAAPKMAALLAAATEAANPVRLTTLESRGVVLIYGRGDLAVEAGRRLADTLDVTVLVTGDEDVAPPRRTDFPVVRGFVRQVKGALGGFEVSIDQFAQSLPQSRGTLDFGPARNGAVSRCDILLDLSGGGALVPAFDLRAGYVRVDPNDKVALERALFEASKLVGTFDKPRAIDFTASLCAHSRSQKVGCRRCLDLCPTGAIAPAGDHVAIDPAICAGCGQCAAACPTGAAAYDIPDVESLMRRLRRLVLTYREAGGADALILFHDGEHGAELIEALARHGAGLPAYVLPVAVNEVTQVGHETICAALAYGATGVAFLTRLFPRHDIAGLDGTVDLTRRIASGLGFGADILKVIAADDPDELRRELDDYPVGEASPRPASFMPAGKKRALLDLALVEMHRAAPKPVDRIELPHGAMLGGLDIDVAGCTLCLSCVSACPTGALADNADRPLLSFDEALCVQCGLCQTTCPEKVITLKPRIDFAARKEGRRVVKQEEPFHCIKCAKPFGTKSTVEKIAAQLAGKHWMYSGENASRLDLIRMCDDCRVEATVNDSFDPHAAERPRPRTTDDYLREREQAKDEPH